MALGYPELLEKRATIERLYSRYALAHNGELAEHWEERKPHHAGETGEKHLQGAHVASLFPESFKADPIVRTLLRWGVGGWGGENVLYLYISLTWNFSPLTCEVITHQLPDNIVIAALPLFLFL